MKEEPITEKILGNMALLKRNQFEELAGFHGPDCVSVFLPTQRFGMEVLEGKDKIAYDNQLRAVRRELESKGLKPREIDRHLEPALNLLDDLELWRNLSDGLAVFLGERFFKYFLLPVPFEPQHYIADHFYLRPLAPMAAAEDQFLLLTLTLHGARLFECTAYTMAEINIVKQTPARVEEVVGYDYEQRLPQYRGQRAGQGAAGVYHGQGDDFFQRKEEVLQYLRAMDDGLMILLHDRREPLVVACQEYLFPVYREANHYKYLVENPIPVNPEGIEQGVLHDKAMAILTPLFEETRLAKIRQYEGLAHTMRASAEFEEIIIAAVDGRIDTLFVPKGGADVFGTFNRADNSVRIDRERNHVNASLLNLAVTRTLLNNGRVFLLDPQEMPEKNTLINAIFRY